MVKGVRGRRTDGTRGACDADDDRRGGLCDPD